MLTDTQAERARHRRLRFGGRLRTLLLGVCAISAVGCGYPEPDRDLLPPLPEDIEVLTETFGYNDHVGGGSSWLMLVTSGERSPDEVATVVARLFDSDANWQALEPGVRFDTGRAPPAWEYLPNCDEEPTTVHVDVVEEGEVLEVMPGDERGDSKLVVDDRAVLIQFYTWYIDDLTPPSGYEFPFCD